MATVNENDIEYGFIGTLTNLKYTYREDIRSRKALDKNFIQKFEALNKVQLSSAEATRLLEEIISPDVFKASKTLRQRNTFVREDGSPLQYTLVNIKDWCKNDFEVVNQLRINTQDSNHRYDVILLLNGIPVVQIELKTLEVNPRKAMQQIIDYKKDAGNGYTNSLLCFMQLFVVSNKASTYYFANNNNKEFLFDAEEQFLPIYQWAEDNNKKVTGLTEFSQKFLAKCTLGEMISRYMVLVEIEQKLIMMRPYQIYAVKAIVDCIHQNRGNGYIWHTTGSGKTLTSFKASTLLKDNPDVEKCLFVVDRKDLDRQTREEFNKFQEGCVEQNTNTEALVRRLLSEDYADKVIVTTIQKLGIALDGSNANEYKIRLAPLRNKRMVFIFDECHRSQFGENHKAIKEFFPNAQLFGFTGTPIFEDNAAHMQRTGEEKTVQTTEDIFQKQLHAYTITHAIEDKNVLRFHIEHFKPEGKYVPKSGDALTQKAVAEAILEKHNAVTANRQFNAVLATASINNAIEYYQIFKNLQAAKGAANENYVPLNIACVFSPPAEGNKDVKQLQDDLLQEKEDNKVAPEEKKAALKGIIADYNTQYGTAHTLNEFDGYYQDVQSRIKAQKWSNADYAHSNKIDLVIVVDMLLTGFDSKYLNTLYVDKNLKYHGLIQAFSRTNRILNGNKPNGNILDFRQQGTAVDEAIRLFSGEQEARAREIWLVEPAPVVVAKYAKAVAALGAFMESRGLDCKPEEVANLKGDLARVEFVQHFKEVQRLKTQLDQYTDLPAESARLVEELLPEDQLRSFKGAYLETAKRLQAANPKGGGTDGGTNLPELDFEFVLFASTLVDYDYIMSLIAGYTQKEGKKEKMTREELIEQLSAASNLMEERDGIVAYINSLEVGRSLNEREIREGYTAFKTALAEAEVSALAGKHGLEAAALHGFVAGTLERMIFDADRLDQLMEPLELGWKVRAKKQEALMADLSPVLKKRAGGSEISGLKVYDEHHGE